MNITIAAVGRAVVNLVSRTKPTVKFLICFAALLPIASYSYQLAPHKPGAKIQITEQSVSYLQAGVATKVNLVFSVPQTQGYLRLRLNSVADLSVVASEKGSTQQWLFDLSEQSPELGLTLLGQNQGRPALIFVAELFETELAADSATAAAISSRVLGVAFTVGDGASEAENKPTVVDSSNEKSVGNETAMRYLPATETINP